MKVNIKMPLFKIRATRKRALTLYRKGSWYCV